jgi:hypothetical protein
VPEPVLATTLVMALVVVLTYFALSLGPHLWRTNRWGFWFLVAVGGTAIVWCLLQAFYSDRLGSREVAAQVGATVVASIIAVVGSILGALWGARVGAKATDSATARAIAADREVIQEQREHADNAALRAFAAECRLNAAVLQPRNYEPDPRLRAPLLITGYTGSASSIAVLSPDDQVHVQTVMQDVLWFNQLIAARLSQHQIGREISGAMATELEQLADNLPRQLTDLATRLDDAFAERAGRPQPPRQPYPAASSVRVGRT